MHDAIHEKEHPVCSTGAIRSHFPALRREHRGQPVAYFDGPGGTQVPGEVAEAVRDYLLHHNANTHWAFPTSEETDAMLSDARSTLAAFLGASSREIAFGANMTTLTFHLARAIGRRLSAGDEIVVTELDHHANVAPWRALEIERGVTIRVARVDVDSGELDWEDLERQLTRRTRVLAIGAASNAIGTITDVRRAAEMARGVGARVFVDAVHYAPHELVDVRELDCDFLACSAYKFYGPHIGILYGREELLAELDFPKLLPSPNTAPERAETGTQNHEGIAGAAAAVKFLASLGTGDSLRDRLRQTYRVLHERGQQLVRELWGGLDEIDGVQIFGPRPDEPRTPTVSFAVDGIASGEVSRALASRGVFVSNGDFYATTLVERLGFAREGLVRAGCACYSTAAEIRRLVEGVSEVAHR